VSTVLHIVGSPRESSASTALAKHFLEHYRRANPNDEIVTCDLWDEPLHEFRGLAADGKLKTMAQMELSEAEAQQFHAVDRYIEQLRRADKLVVSAGMWNFGVPYRLKHWLDLIIQPGQTFGFNPETGYFGMVEGKPVQFLLATGGDYSEGSPMAAYDMFVPYLDLVFGFIGFRDRRFVVHSGTVLPPEMSEPARERAYAAAVEAASKL